MNTNENESRRCMMKLLSDSSDLKEQLIRLMKEYDQYSWAVAWAGKDDELTNLLLENSKRIQHLVIGTHFYQTHPDFIESFMNHENVRFMKPSRGVFHPKLYFFESEDGSKWEALIGSPNFTKAAFSTNDELAVLFTSAEDSDENTRQRIMETIENYWEFAEEYSEADLEDYRAKRREAEVHLEALKPVPPKRIRTDQAPKKDRFLEADLEELLEFHLPEIEADDNALRHRDLHEKVQEMDTTSEEFHQCVWLDSGPVSGLNFGMNNGMDGLIVDEEFRSKLSLILERSVDLHPQAVLAQMYDDVIRLYESYSEMNRPLSMTMRTFAVLHPKNVTSIAYDQDIFRIAEWLLDRHEFEKIMKRHDKTKGTRRQMECQKAILGKMVPLLKSQIQGKDDLDLHILTGHFLWKCTEHMKPVKTWDSYNPQYY